MFVKKFLENLKSWATIWLWFLIMILIGGTIYASIDTKFSWDVLKSDDWNKVATELNSLPWMIASFATTSCPSWWIAADWSNWTPDLRWVFIRWANNFGTGESNRDLDRSNSWSWVLTYQSDAIRNIKTNWYLAVEIVWLSWVWTNYYWPISIYSNNSQGTDHVSIGSSWVQSTFDFDVSRVVPTWLDNHPKNIALIYCVKQ